MKRIEYTAAAIRLLGILFLTSLLVDSFAIQALAQTRVISTWQPAVHFLGLPLFEAHAGIVLLFFLKLALGIVLTVYPLRLGKLFWLGILPVPGGFRGIVRKNPPGDYLDEPETDTWRDQP